MDWILEHKLDLFNIATAVVALAAAIAAATPSETDNKWLATARKFLDLIAFNVGFAKNSTDKKD